MASSKTLKIVIPIIAVIAVGIFFGFTAVPFDNTIPSKTESSVDFETKDTEDLFLEDSSNESQAEEISTGLVGDVIVIKTTPVIETLEEDQLLRKTIPANYKFGNFFDNGLLMGMEVSELDNSDQIHSIRFTNKHNGDINAIVLNLSTKSTREVIVGIQEDNGTGYPSGNWRDEESYVKTVVQGRDKNPIELPKSYQVLKDKVYHIVLQIAPTSSTNLTPEKSLKNHEDELPVLVIHYKGNTPHQPFNPEDPDIYWPDPAINTLFYNGVDWMTLDKWPVYLLSYIDGTVDGQPYTLKANWVIQENRPVGQTIIPHSDYQVSKFALLVSKDGNPADDLYYGIQDLNNTLLASGLFAKSDDLTKNVSLIEISLDEPIDFKAGELYRFYVYSPIPRGEDHYNLFGHEFSLNNTVGYGGQINRLVSSSDFEHWGDWNDADAVFVLTTSP